MGGPMDLCPEQLFLRYAFPCAKENDPEYERLKAMAKEEIIAERSLLKFKFRHAFLSLREFAQRASRPVWNLATVQEYWRHHHGHADECRVQRCTVIAIFDELVLEVAGPERKFKALNLYALPLFAGTTVYVHRRVVADFDLP